MTRQVMMLCSQNRPVCFSQCGDTADVYVTWMRRGQAALTRPWCIKTDAMLGEQAIRRVWIEAKICLTMNNGIGVKCRDYTAHPVLLLSLSKSLVCVQAILALAFERLQVHCHWPLERLCARQNTHRAANLGLALALWICLIGWEVK